MAHEIEHAGAERARASAQISTSSTNAGPSAAIFCVGAQVFITENTLPVSTSLCNGAVVQNGLVSVFDPIVHPAQASPQASEECIRSHTFTCR
jgi:hypothetical protein